MKHSFLGLVVSFAALFVYPLLSPAQEIPTLEYAKDVAGLVGNGEFLVRTTATGYGCVRGASFSSNYATEATCTASVFFPGGVEYVYSDGAKVLYGADKESGMIALVCGSSDSHEGFTTVNEATYVKEKERLYQPYLSRLVMDTPDKTLDLSVQFSQYLLDLGFNGHFMLCELFRWLDIWARDLGSGLMPGCLATGRVVPARLSLEYDLQRYARCRPTDCKNTNDPSQGGTAEAIGWTTRSIWNYYMYSGDRSVLQADMDIIRPWVDFWCRRDYNEDGLIIDVTEFMDHMIMMLTTQGATTLAANSMFASMLTYSARIEKELGNTQAAERYEALYQRTVNALNTVFWNSGKGYFKNMAFWDAVSERSAQPAQSMLLKIGATDADRSRQTLDYLKTHNWIDCGSLTITPRMNHVPLSNDQNMKVWPWWNLWEAEARFRWDDPQGGYQLLSLAASTVRDEHYPGLIEEDLDMNGNTYGGNAFPTAAGNLLEVVVKDLFGIQAVKPGWTVAQVVPNVPAQWKKYRCRVPVPGGFITLESRKGKKTVTVESDLIHSVYVTAETQVVGAEKAVYVAPQHPVAQYEKVIRKALPPVPAGPSVQFFDARLHTHPLPGIRNQVNIESLCCIDKSSYAHLVVNGNTLPLPARDALERFVDRGGQVIFYGARANVKSEVSGAGILGEQCGIVDWVDCLPARKKVYLREWDQTATDNGGSDVSYTATVDLPAEFCGHDLYFELGPLTGIDSVFVNGRLVGCYTALDTLRRPEYLAATDYPQCNPYTRVSRMYILSADSQDFLRFGSSNSVEIRIHHDACREGLTERNRPNIGMLMGQKEWQYIDEDIPQYGFEYPKRKGVNYWGNEQFFNSWSTKQGLYGIGKHGRGVRFADGTILGDLPFKDIETDAIYTDFAIFAPMDFEVLAYTTTTEQLLFPMPEEHYPCAVRVTHNDQGGGYVLVAPALTKGPLGEMILTRLLKE